MRLRFGLASSSEMILILSLSKDEVAASRQGSHTPGIAHRSPVDALFRSAISGAYSGER
jgi:hypothetical protein